jgi:hypothetical protein
MRFVQKTKNIDRRLKQLQNELPKIVRAASTEFRDLTPIDKGNARRSTVLAGNEIQANYGYANRLNQGWSKQAPKGMTGNTIAFIRRLLQKI